MGSGDDFLQRAAPDSRTLANIEWLLIAALLTTFVILGFLPAWRTMNTDFPNYYLAASIRRQGIPLDRAYDWRWFQRHKDHLQIDQSLVGFAPHPPMCAVPMLPLTWLPSLEAKRVWLVLNLGFLALALWILARVTQLLWRHLLLLAFLCILPLRENFLFGQYYVLILLLLCVAYCAYCRGRHFTSGAVLAAAASLKIFPVFFLILFLRKRNWRALAGIVTGGAVLAAISLLLFGGDVHRIYLLEVLPRAARRFGGTLRAAVEFLHRALPPVLSGRARDESSSVGELCHRVWVCASDRGDGVAVQFSAFDWRR